MNKFINKVNSGEILKMSDVIDYTEDGIASVAMVQRKSLTLTVFAFDKGQKLSTHKSNGDAFVQVLDGTVTINIDGIDFDLTAGESIIMPAETPHAVMAKERFKMLLTVVKPEEEPV
ncbi:MAG: cupin [Epulopiscium sp. Nuni2H_MBin003]|nr:MAG: cupin [Epulopiscium sp. Nuni2H_MBin003]